MESSVMGNEQVRVHPKRVFPTRNGSSLFDVDSDNGYNLSDVLINDDVLTVILSHLPPTDIISNCRMVCKSWCNLIDDRVWKHKLHKLSLSCNEKIFNLPWHILCWLVLKNGINRNLVQNPSGAEDFTHWEKFHEGGNGFKVERGPLGTEENMSFESCFVTSYNQCSKLQKIDLYKVVGPDIFMDTVQPDIHISEWYAGRWDCRAVFKIHVALQNNEGVTVDEFVKQYKCGGDYGSDWRQVSHTFKNYGAGVRYVAFCDGGVDEQFWNGHYGSKMTAACVELRLPSCRITQESCRLSSDPPSSWNPVHLQKDCEIVIPKKVTTSPQTVIGVELNCDIN